MPLNPPRLRQAASLRRRALFAPLAAAFAMARARPARAQFSFQREQTVLEIAIRAGADVNPDDKGRAAPILVRVYELKSEGAFEAADYFSLHADDKALLGADLLVRDEFILRPGDAKAIRRKSHPDLAAIGVVAGYRDLAQADWRAVQKTDPAPEAAWYRAVIPAHKLRLQVDLQARGIRLIPLP